MRSGADNTAISTKAARFLERKLFGKLATISKDGYPHLTPIWYMLERGRIIINTNEGTVKVRNIKRDNRVALLVDDVYRYILIIGRAFMADERDPYMDIEKLAIRYEGKRRGMKEAREIYWKMKRISIEIKPERIIENL